MLFLRSFSTNAPKTRFVFLDQLYNLYTSSSGLAVKHPALGTKGHRFDPSQRSKLFQRLISRLTTSWVDDHVKGAAVSTGLLKIKGDVKDPLRKDVKHSGSDHPEGISAPVFRTAPLWVVGEWFLNHYKIETVPSKRQPGDSPPKRNKQTI